MAIPVACGSSQARDWIGVADANLGKPRLQTIYASACDNARSLTH